jgi:tetratricopeptide (TPR) repeat protein
MSSIRTLNLLWERRLRGVYPVSCYALGDDGTLMVAVPRPLEPRAYDLTRLALDGGSEIAAGFAVETLLKLEVSSRSSNCIGMTADDLYQFHAGDKHRFLGERQLFYIDVALNAEGQQIATVFSDRGGASFVLAYGDIEGRVAWLRDVDMPLTTVAISRSGNRIAAGTEGGVIQLFDSSRRDVWEFGQGEAVRALACSEDGVFVAYGTALGGIGVVDGQGTRLWEARLPGEVRAIVLSGDGRVCAALCRPETDPNTTRLFCLEETGRIGWEYDPEQVLPGLSLSGNGRFVATSARNGVITVFEVVPGERAAAAIEQALTDAPERADALAAAGDLAGACAVLQAAVEANPGALAIYEQLTELKQRRKQAALALADERTAVNDYAEALSMLQALLGDDPLDLEIVGAVIRLRKERAAQLFDSASAAHGEAAEAMLREALAVDPTLIAARRELAVLRARQTEEADAEAERLLAAGQLEAGVAAAERAQALDPTAVRANKLERAQTALEFAAGMAAYNEKRYQEAVFQFKKALHRDPSHTEAKRYLAFAQRFAQDSATDTLNDRFSRLE